MLGIASVAKFSVIVVRDKASRTRSVFRTWVNPNASYQANPNTYYAVKKGRYHKSYKIALDAIKDALLQCSNVNNSAENEVNDGIAIMKDKVHAQPEGVEFRRGSGVSRWRKAKDSNGHRSGKSAKYSSEGSKEVTSTNIVKFESNNGIGSSAEGKPRKKETIILPKVFHVL
ncbi:hypothetical protein Tco_1515357 [Tanacetum coccineum]